MPGTDSTPTLRVEHPARLCGRIHTRDNELCCLRAPNRYGPLDLHH